jgi:O-methyltransferase
MLKDTYLYLVKKVLTDQINENIDARLDGRDWPKQGFTMIGDKRLNNIQDCVQEVLKNNVEGDFLEAGVWKGGATIFMRALLEAEGVKTRKVWVADSFEGLPPPNPLYAADNLDTHYQYSDLAVSLEEVKNNFRKFNLLDDQVVFIKGWFHETLFTAPVEKLAILRLDGDMYESTMTTLNALYDKVQDGGYVIVDDYGYIESCRQAIHDFFASRSISPELKQIDWTGVFWKK